MLVELEMAQGQPDAAARFNAVQQRAAELGLQGTVLAALLRRAELPDAEAAHAALALAERVAPTLMARAEVWLCAARGLMAEGADVGPVLRAGRDWLLATAEAQVDEPFREAFLQRHTAHRDLLALAARQDRSGNAA